MQKAITEEAEKRYHVRSITQGLEIPHCYSLRIFVFVLGLDAGHQFLQAEHLQYQQ
jgi:hypothetical protein